MSNSSYLKKSQRPNEIPRLDFSELQPKTKANENAKEPQQKDFKISSPRLERSAHPAVPAIKTGDSHSINKPKTPKIQNLNQQVKREVVYKNKQVFYKEVPVENSSMTPTNKGPRGKFWYLDEDKPVEPLTPKQESKESSVDQMAQYQAAYVNTPYRGMQEAMKNAAEADVERRRRGEVMEQVLIDLLSRHVISDAEQDRDPSRRNPVDPTSLHNAAPLRNKSRRLHDTKVSTTGASTESNLRDRTTFSARVLTRDGRDALRELFGFYFHTDSTLTVYEFRLFGKKNLKALPLIERARYAHVKGRWRGKDYEASDLQLGRNLTFLTRNQPHLPDSIKRSDVLTIRVCEVDGNSGGASYDLSSYRSDHSHAEALERNDRKIAAKVQEAVRACVVGRSVSVVVGIGKLFRRIDRSGDGKLNRSELNNALLDFNINLPSQDLEAVWRVVDENGDQSIDFGEFLRTFIGEMNEYRKSIVRKVFLKLDPHKTGVANLLDLRKLYSAKKHPLVSGGQISQSEMEERFVKSLADIAEGPAGEVSFVEFEEYYEGLSLCVGRDEDFANILANCWGV